jgi:hypothetical protein
MPKPCDGIPTLLSIVPVPGVTKVITLLEFSAVIQIEGSCGIQRDKSSRELSAGNSKGTDPQRRPAFEPPQYVIIGLFVMVTNGLS